MPYDFSQHQAILLDLDGTIYNEEVPIPGAAELIRRLQSERRTFACISNSTNSPQRLSQRLKRMGLNVPPDQIYTAAAAAVDYVLEKHGSGKLPRVYNLATEGVQEMLDGRVQWVSGAGEPCDAVICGAPYNACAGLERQRVALQLVRTGAELVGTSADRVFPSPQGVEIGSGALTHMLAYAANSAPVFCGKPDARFFRNLCDRLRVEPSQCLLIGDNVESDVAGGKPLGIRTILVLTGITRRGDLEHLPPHLKPEAVVDDLFELL